MGIGFILLIWAVVVVALACIFSLSIQFLVSFLTSTRSANSLKRKNVLKAATRIPILFIIWAAIIFVFQASINSALLQRDCGIGDSFDCPLSNGYALSGIDTTYQMRLYNPATLPGGDGSIGDCADAVDNVILLQESGSFIVGGTHDYPMEQVELPHKANSYFVLDTKSGTKKIYNSEQHLLGAIQELGIKLDLDAITDVYVRNRITWFDYLVFLLLILPPTYYLYGIGRSVMQLREPCVLSNSQL